ncbi:hypothetical protein [Enterobacter cloacae]|uniref:hypothetical protein n=1 Tax=Enterobacter cloacae TaxID=550 RepID=UPI0030C1EE08
MEADILLWAYRNGDFDVISAEITESINAMKNYPESSPGLHLKISLITHFQVIGMTYKKPELQQLSIVILSIKKNWQLNATINEAVLLMEDIIP